MPPLSILDLAFVPEGRTPADALRKTLDLAQHAETWGYRRFWLAEHHNMVGIASAATAVVISYVAAGTRTIRVDGIMLPTEEPDHLTPNCPSCSSAVKLREARRGANAGQKFWGCPNFPECRGTRNF